MLLEITRDNTLTAFQESQFETRMSRRPVAARREELAFRLFYSNIRKLHITRIKESLEFFLYKNTQQSKSALVKILQKIVDDYGELDQSVCKYDGTCAAFTKAGDRCQMPVPDDCQICHHHRASNVSDEDEIERNLEIPDDKIPGWFRDKEGNWFETKIKKNVEPQPSNDVQHIVVNNTGMRIPVSVLPTNNTIPKGYTLIAESIKAKLPDDVLNLEQRTEIANYNNSTRITLGDGVMLIDEFFPDIKGAIVFLSLDGTPKCEEIRKVIIKQRTWTVFAETNCLVRYIYRSHVGNVLSYLDTMKFSYRHVTREHLSKMQPRRDVNNPRSMSKLVPKINSTNSESNTGDPLCLSVYPPRPKPEEHAQPPPARIGTLIDIEPIRFSSLEMQLLTPLNIPLLTSQGGGGCESIQYDTPLLDWLNQPAPEKPLSAPGAPGIETICPVLTSSEPPLIDEKECVVCLSAKPTHVFAPCGHLVCCEVCVVQIENCPVCRADIISKVKVYTL